MAYRSYSILLALLLWLSPVCLGQTTVPEMMPSLLGSTEAHRQMLQPIVDVGGDGATTAPAVEVQHKLIREGTILPDCVGHLSRTADGQMQFVFENADGSDLPYPPMVVLPNQQLLAMESATAGVNHVARFRVTGMVTEYNGKNYIMLEQASSAAFSKAPGEGELSTQSTAAPAPATVPSTPLGPGQDALRAIRNSPLPAREKVAGTPGPTADRTTGDNSVAPGAGVLQTLHEGTLVIDRIVRLSKTADGQVQLCFESDGKALLDPPMLVLPNLKRGSLESAVNGSSHDLLFRVTGSVTEYKQRNYILLDKVLVVPAFAKPF